MFLFQELFIVCLKLKPAAPPTPRLVTMDQGRCKTRTFHQRLPTEVLPNSGLGPPALWLNETHRSQLPLQGDIYKLQLQDSK